MKPDEINPVIEAEFVKWYEGCAEQHKGLEPPYRPRPQDAGLGFHAGWRAAIQEHDELLDHLRHAHERLHLLTCAVSEMTTELGKILKGYEA